MFDSTWISGEKGAKACDNEDPIVAKTFSNELDISKFRAVV